MYRTPSQVGGHPSPYPPHNPSTSLQDSSLDSSFLSEATHFFGPDYSRRRSGSGGDKSRLYDVISPIQPQKDEHHGWTLDAVELEALRELNFEDKFDFKELDIRRGPRLVGLMSAEQQAEYVKETQTMIIGILDSLPDPTWKYRGQGTSVNAELSHISRSEGTLPSTSWIDDAFNPASYTASTNLDIPEWERRLLKRSEQDEAMERQFESLALRHGV